MMKKQMKSEKENADCGGVVCMSTEAIIFKRHYPRAENAIEVSPLEIDAAVFHRVYSEPYTV